MHLKNGRGHHWKHGEKKDHTHTDRFGREMWYTTFLPSPYQQVSLNKPDKSNAANKDNRSNRCS